MRETTCLVKSQEAKGFTKKSCRKSLINSLLNNVKCNNRIRNLPK